MAKKVNGTSSCRYLQRGQSAPRSGPRSVEGLNTWNSASSSTLPRRVEKTCDP